MHTQSSCINVSARITEGLHCGVIISFSDKNKQWPYLQIIILSGNIFTQNSRLHLGTKSKSILNTEMISIFALIKYLKKLNICCDFFPYYFCRSYVFQTVWMFHAGHLWSLYEWYLCCIKGINVNLPCRLFDHYHAVERLQTLHWLEVV